MAEGTPQPAAVPEQPIAENEQVKALLALLKDNNTPGYEEFAKLIGHVSEMEQRLSEATEELKAMRQEMQGLQNHSLKDTLQKNCKAMEENITAMRQRLSKLKKQIIDGCKSILADFKERGAVALNGITGFLHLRPALESIQNGAEKSMQASDRAVPELTLLVPNTMRRAGILKTWGAPFKESLRRQKQKKTGRLPECSKELSKWSVPLYLPLAVVRSGH